MENLGIQVIQFVLEAAVVEIEMVVGLVGWCWLMGRKVGEEVIVVGNSGGAVVKESRDRRRSTTTRVISELIPWRTRSLHRMKSNAWLKTAEWKMDI